MHNPDREISTGNQSTSLIDGPASNRVTNESERQEQVNESNGQQLENPDIAGSSSDPINYVEDTMPCSIPSSGEGIFESETSEPNMRESEQGNESEVIETQEESNIDEFQAIAGMCVENRNFLRIKLGDTEYTALYDPGATISLVHAKIAENFKDSLKTIDSMVESAMGTPYKCLGKLKLNLVIDGVLKNLQVTAIERIKHDAILVIDLIKLFDIESRREQTE